MRTCTWLLMLTVIGCGSGGGEDTGSDARSGGDADASAVIDGAPGDPDASLPPSIELVAGLVHTCARFHDGRTKCWGENGDGQLGLGDLLDRGDEAGEMGSALPAVDLGSGRVATALAAGANHTCAILDDATVRCWGKNDGGQLGIGDTLTRGDERSDMGDDLPAVDLGAGRTAVAIAAGGRTTCVVLDDGGVKCWGMNTFGQLGQGSYLISIGGLPGELGDALPAIDLGTGRTALAVSVGGSHACALLDDQRVKCWGANSGVLGLGDLAARGDGPDEMGDDLPAVDLGDSLTAARVAAGRSVTCAIIDDGRVKCWGGGGSSAGSVGLGNLATYGDVAGEMGTSLPPVSLGEGHTASWIGTSLDSVCALLDDETLKCWGRNSGGTLGLGDTDDRGDDPGEMGDALPAIQLGSAGVDQVAVGGFHVCAALDDGAVKCWGSNVSGTLGQGDTEDRGDQPFELGGQLAPVDLGF
jgi:alpha-tubulin suppressor-like RCC1 family protein